MPRRSLPHACIAPRGARRLVTAVAGVRRRRVQRRRPLPAARPRPDQADHDRTTELDRRPGRRPAFDGVDPGPASATARVLPGATVAARRRGGRDAPVRSRSTARGATAAPSTPATRATATTSRPLLLVDRRRRPAPSRWRSRDRRAERRRSSTGPSPASRRPPARSARARRSRPARSQGINGAGIVGYSGPCPPAGPTHTYRFTCTTSTQQVELPATAPTARRRWWLGDRTPATHRRRAEVTGTYARVRVGPASCVDARRALSRR